LGSKQWGPLTGATAEAMDAWITEGVTKGKAGETRYSKSPKRDCLSAISQKGLPISSNQMQVEHPKGIRLAPFS